MRSSQLGENPETRASRASSQVASHENEDRGEIEAGGIIVGDEIEFVRDGQVWGAALVCGVLVGGRALDKAESGDKIECTLRGTGVEQALPGDLIRSRS